MTAWERTRERAGRARPLQRQEGACRLEAGATRGCGGLRLRGLKLRQPGRLRRPRHPGKSVGAIFFVFANLCWSFCCSFKKDRDCVFARVTLTIHKNKRKNPRGPGEPGPYKGKRNPRGRRKAAPTSIRRCGHWGGLLGKRLGKSSVCVRLRPPRHGRQRTRLLGLPRRGLGLGAALGGRGRLPL